MFLPDFTLYFVPLMHPELGNSYVLTFLLNILKGSNIHADGNLRKLYGIHKFDNLQFSFIGSEIITSSTLAHSLTIGRK